MTPTTLALLCAIASGLAAALVLLPMATRIPARLESQWAREFEAETLARKEAHGPAAQPYPLAHKAVVVTAAMLLGVVVFTTYGLTEAGAAHALYYFSLLLLAAINVRHTLLPDSIVLATLWAGLLFHTHAGNAADHVYGAALCYGVPFLIALAFRLIARKEVIGHGDLKALAMAGAWFGWRAVPTLLAGFVVALIACAIAMPLLGRKSGVALPTGPAHLLASLVVTLGVTVF